MNSTKDKARDSSNLTSFTPIIEPQPWIVRQVSFFVATPAEIREASQTQEITPDPEIEKIGLANLAALKIILHEQIRRTSTHYNTYKPSIQDLLNSNDRIREERNEEKLTCQWGYGYTLWSEVVHDAISTTKKLRTRSCKGEIASHPGASTPYRLGASTVKATQFLRRMRATAKKVYVERLLKNGDYNLRK